MATVFALHDFRQHSFREPDPVFELNTSSICLPLYRCKRTSWFILLASSHLTGNTLKKTNQPQQHYKKEEENTESPSCLEEEKCLH